MSENTELGFKVVAEIGKNKSFKSVDEYAKYLESQIGVAIDKSLLVPLDKAGKKWQYMIKSGRQYRRVILNTKDGNLSSFDISRQGFTKKQAGRILASRTESGAKAIINEISREQKLTNADLLKAKKEAKAKAGAELKLTRASQLSSILGNNFSQQDFLRFELSNAKSKLNSLIESFYELEKEGGEAFEKTKNKIIGASNEVARLKKQLDKLTKKGPVQKLVDTFKRVGFYRIARRLFQVVEQGLSQSVSSLAKFDGGVNDTMSSITSQFTILSNSLMVMVYPILEMIKPLLEGITRTVANFANTVSYLVAKLSGSATYLKVNTDYMKDFNQEMNKFSFDKFESLSDGGDIDPSKMFEKANVSEGMTTEMDKMAEKISTIAGIIAGIGTYVIVKKFLDGTIQTKFKKLGEVFTSGGWVKFAGIAGIIIGITSAVEGIIQLIKTDGKSVTGWIKTILGLVGAVAGVVALVKGKTIAGMIAGGLAVASVVGLIITNAVSSANTADVAQYANGGIAEKGDLFVANERGPELVYSGHNNSSSIMNIEQFREATMQALFAWWDTAKYDLPEGGNFTLDPADIANSKRFVSALNRKNSGLNLR